MKEEFLHFFHSRYVAMTIDTELHRVRDEVQETTRTMIQHSKNDKYIEFRSKIICLAFSFLEIRSKHVMYNFNEVQIYCYIFFIKVKVSIV